MIGCTEVYIRMKLLCDECGKEFAHEDPTNVEISDAVDTAVSTLECPHCGKQDEVK